MDYQIDKRMPHYGGCDPVHRVTGAGHCTAGCGPSCRYTAPRRQVGTCVQSADKYGSHPVGMVYATVQTWSEPYTPAEALDRGTLWKELDLPFLMGGCGQTKGGFCR